MQMASLKCKLRFERKYINIITTALYIQKKKNLKIFLNNIILNNSTEAELTTDINK